MIIDTHCHLTDKRLYEDVDGVIGRAKRAGVEKIIVPTINLKDLSLAIKIANKYEGVYCLAGIYPGQARKSKNWKINLDLMEKLIRKKKKVVGIGEIGLDCYWNRQGLDLDKKVFKAQLELAMKLDVPVVIHNRLAEKEIGEVFGKYAILPRGVFHCWSGDKEFLEYVLGKGFYVSFCGNITYSSGSTPGVRRRRNTTPGEKPPLRDLLKQVPLSRLLLETDSPYLAPKPMRGKLNEPKNVKITAKFMADVLGVSFKSLINQTTKNSLCLFCLGN